MREILHALKGARLIAKGIHEGRKVLHFLLTDGRVLEIVLVLR